MSKKRTRGDEDSVDGKAARPKRQENTYGDGLVDWLNSAVSHFHCCEEARRRLLACGFQEIYEKDEWKLQKGGRYFFTRDQSSLVAFAVGQNYQPGNGCIVIGTHTDSPCLRVKPVSKITSGGICEIGVQTYGGGLWTSWFDRDLGLCGRALVKVTDEASGETTFQHKLVRIDGPVCRIPMLAIHLNRGSGTKFELNKEDHLSALLCSSVRAQLEAQESGSPHIAGNHHPALLVMLAANLGCEPEDICDFDVQLMDVQPSTIGGAFEEFIFSGRLDNQASCYAALTALIEMTGTPESLAKESGVRMIAMFDHEEVGSRSISGAGGPLMLDTVRRIVGSNKTTAEGVVERTFRNSFLISCDMAHALHPNYKSKHERNHQPKMNGGMVVKVNCNQRYATDGVSAFIFKELGKRADLPVQEFVVRQDCACGSTIGPILSALTGIKTVDIGMAQLSMHSCREMMGSEDPGMAVRHFKSVFEHYFDLSKSVRVDKAAPAPAASRKPVFSAGPVRSCMPVGSNL